MPVGSVSNGPGASIARDFQFGTALHQDGLAIAHFFKSVLIATFGNCELGHGCIKFGAGDKFSLPELDHALVCKFRFFQHCGGLPHGRGLFNVDFIAAA